DSLDLVGAICQRIVATKITDAERRTSFNVTATAVGVRRVQFSDQLADDIVDVPTCHGVLEQFSVTLAHGVPIHAVHARIVKIVTLEAPGVVENLLPLRYWID